LADIEWMQMAERVKILPLVVLAVVVILGVLLYWVSTRPRETRQTPASPPVPPNENRPAPPREPGATAPAAAPAASTSPGDKILEGADGAFRKGMFETSLKFYKDFELRYAGTEVYDRNVTKVWERMHSSNASMAKRDETLPAYLETRRKLADEWKRIKPLLDAPPGAESREQVRTFADSLPPGDGRLKIIEAWRDEKK
jgi:hypothetical protein